MDKVVHFEIPADDPERAKKFYSKVFGWNIIDVPNMNYSTIYTAKTDKKGMIAEKGAINGGMFKRRADEKPILTINVNSINNYLGKLRKSGRRVMPVQKIGEMGLYARFVDSEGNVVGLWENLI